MKQSGGGVQITSVVGAGTAVTLFLPRCSERVSAPLVIGPVTAAGGTETILVAEDDAAVREAAIALRREIGYQVLEASNGDDALGMIRSA